MKHFFFFFFTVNFNIYFFYFWKTNTEGKSFLLPWSVNAPHVNIKNIVKFRLYKMYFEHSQMNKWHEGHLKMSTRPLCYREKIRAWQL